MRSQDPPASHYSLASTVAYIESGVKEGVLSELSTGVQVLSRCADG